MIIACSHCGALYRQPELGPNERAECMRCGTVLGTYNRLDAPSWLALTLAAFLVFLIANALPVASMTMQGGTQQATLLEAVVLTGQQGYVLVALMTGLAGFAVPLLQLLSLLWILTPLALGRRPLAFATSARMLGWLRPWSMVPVFLLAAVVAVVKLADTASVHPGIGLLAFAVLTVLQTLLARLRPKLLGQLAEKTGLVGSVDSMPPVRDTPNANTRAQSITQATALLLAATILYFPANLYPVMRTSTLTDSTDHTILSGIFALWRSGAWDIALIVLVASVMVPAGKILSLAGLVWLAYRRNTSWARERTWLYRVIERIGQWSMLDVYVVVLLTALADFPGLVQVSAQPGAVFFGLVVVLTMLAAMSYDPRVVWDDNLETAVIHD